MKRLSICILLTIFTSLLMSQSIAQWHTSMGTFKIELREDLVPITVNNFKDLTYANFYDNLIFHRVIANFMIQDGCPNGNGYGGPGYTIPDEFNEGILFDIPYVIGMANTGQPNSAGSQYFITVEPFPNGNYSYAAFGTVIEGTDVVEAISEVPTTGPNGNPANKPLTDVVIDSIRIVTPNIYEKVPAEDSLAVDVNGFIVFAVYSNDADLTYEWYVNDELQTETMNVFYYMFPSAGVYEIKNLASNGEYEYPSWWTVTVGGVGAGVSVVPGRAALHQNYPNPFNPETTFSFTLPRQITPDTSLEIFNTRGQLVRRLDASAFTLQDGYTYSATWDGTDASGTAVSTGVYLYRMQNGDDTSPMRKCILMK
jgi:peptidyl-prolyl cis-trans isomerase A (cyclophilin A)